MYRFILIIATLILLGCQTVTEAPEHPQVQALIAQYDELQVDDSDELWPEYDKYKMQDRLEIYRTIQNAFQKLDYEALSIGDRINMDMLNLVIEDKKEQYEFRAHLMPLNSEGGFLAGIVYSVRDFKIQEEEDYHKYLDKLNALPDYLQLRKSHMREGIERNKVSPKLIVENCISLVDDVLKTDPEETIFVGPIMENNSRLEEVTQLVRNKIKPAYQEMKVFLTSEYLEVAPGEIGISEVNDGKAYYEHRTRYFTTFDISPKEVFETGMSEVKRIRSEMESIIQELEYEGTFDEFLTFLRTDPQFYPETGAALLKDAAWITSEIQGELPKYFTHLPRMPLSVKPVPDALAPNYTGGRYSGGSWDNHKSGQYWVNTYNLKSRPLYVLPSLSLHEGVPGHHTQIMLAGELEDVPEFRTQTYLSAFGEGWALYTEYLGKEMGIYKTPYEDFGRLTYEMWRACRLVVDPGMHYMGWTRNEAMKFMADNTALSMHEINTEINRYIGWPAQAISYKMGELKIRELRGKAESALGDRFDIRSFHDKVLENGSVPLTTLESIIDDFIEETLAEPLKE